MPRLDALSFLAVDCQTTGATPALGTILELGWVVARPAAATAPPQGHWVRQPEGQAVPRIIRRLTGVRDADLAAGIRPEEAWRLLREAAASVAPAPVPTVIHFARFELEFLRELHARFGGGDPFPLDVVCLHAIAERLFPHLPRRGLRPLTGYLGRGVDLPNRSACHADATAFVWRNLLPELAARGVRGWDELRAFAASPRPPKGRRAFPLPREQRRALPDRPGIYRFLRANGDVLYVGKATRLRRRVAGHFSASAGRRAREVALEMLTQARDLSHVETASTLEAALLESDEIKRLDPPYNVHLREGERRVWFASSDLRHVGDAPDDLLVLGPVPSRLTVAGLAAVRDLCDGAEATLERRARAVLASSHGAPEAEEFAAGWQRFAALHLSGVGDAASAMRALDRAGRALWAQARTDGLDEAAEGTPDGWEPDRVRRHLERAVIQGTQLLRRARWLTLLACSTVVFREADGERVRALAIEHGAVVRADDVPGAAALPEPRAPRRDRQRIDAAGYDRLRVITTELKRVLDEGGDVVLLIGRRVLTRDAVQRLLRWV